MPASGHHGIKSFSSLVPLTPGSLNFLHGFTSQLQANGAVYYLHLFSAKFVVFPRDVKGHRFSFSGLNKSVDHKGVSWEPLNNPGFAITVGCSPQTDRMSPLQKTMPIQHVEAREVKLVPK